MSEVKKETVCGVVVTFNRKELLKDCLKALTEQTRPLDAILIVDNASTDNTPQALLEIGYIQQLPPEKISKPYESEFESLIKDSKNENIKIIYIRMNENTGGAGGFHEGVKRGYELGYDWIWLMDDDVSAEHNGLEVLLSYKNASECIHPSKKYLNGDRFDWDGFIDDSSGKFVHFKDSFTAIKKTSSVNFGCFEGMLISRRVVKEIGFPDKNYFFCGDDSIYGYHASKFTNVLYVSEILMTKLLDKRNSVPSVLPDYLYARNITFVMKNIAKSKFKFFITRFYQIFRLSVSRAIKHKLLVNALWVWIGYFDGLKGTFGREKRFFK